MNFTEITNIAGQRHNARMLETDTQRAAGTTRELDEKAARDILHELGLDADELLYKIGCIEHELYDDARDDETRWELVDKACADLRYMITNVIGE